MMRADHIEHEQQDYPVLLPHKAQRLVSYLRFLKLQRIKGFTISETPEFEAACVPFFLDRLSRAASYLEFGSGGSTILAAQAGVPFVSVDSDPYFLRAVKRKVAEREPQAAVERTYLHADIGLTEGWGIPYFRETPGKRRLKLWRRYPQAPWQAMAQLPSPHLILIDGRFRAACALSAARFLHGRQGEILFDDYMDRPHYHGVEHFLELKHNVGRMALLVPRTEIDTSALDVAIEKYCADWR